MNQDNAHTAALRAQLARQMAARIEQLACYITAHALPPAAAADLLRDEATRLHQQVQACP